MSPPMDPAERLGCCNVYVHGWSHHSSLDLFGSGPTQQSLTAYIRSGLCGNAPVIPLGRDFLRQFFDGLWPLLMT